MTASTEDELIERALRSARDTKQLAVRGGVRHETARVFAERFGEHFGGQTAIVVADQNTFNAAGRDVCRSFESAGQKTELPFIFGPDVYAEERCVDHLRAALAKVNAIPVAVGSGTINDLTKLAVHQLKRPYMAVATAASMDGYTAYGASITSKGSKQTFDCPAPLVVLADLDVIATAPVGMNASGYADLLAKIAAGADWILADALGIESIDSAVWDTVQRHLREWLSEPAAIHRGEPAALRRLTNGLMMTGFAMQAHKTSRPASGAEHQFSHLWDMQHHTHEGHAPSHGFKVGIGTLASLALYEELLSRDLSAIDIEQAVNQLLTLSQLNAQITKLFGEGELADTAHRETAAKYIDAAALRQQLQRLRQTWPDLHQKLEKQIIPAKVVKQMLQDAAAAYEPEQIGISRDRLRQSYWQALFIRRRFTILDLAHRTGLLDDALTNLFSSSGQFSIV
ncbi:MAG TPA: sn-glycerol-1-phosphate dehydrogenase [Pirellulaceae bacterium]|jgi:glycerol-1-phosphate dehydrogenase [NAD(P)+]